jgi:cytochrome b561
MSSPGSSGTSVNVAPPKYDPLTRWLHAALAAGVVAQLALSSVMHVPAGVGLGVFDWHREAFEWHARVGLALAAVCALHWLWLCLPWCHPGLLHLFPWWQREARAMLFRQLVNLARLRLPTVSDSTLAGTVHGLGLAAVSGSASGGIVNYLGYFRGAPIPRWVLHHVSQFHITMGYLIWAFVIAHVGMALLHSLSGRAEVLGIFRPDP